MRTSTRTGPRAVALTTCVALLVACSFHHHRIGSGAAGLGSTSARQYYILFGLFRLNEVDTQRFTEDAVSYDIYTELAFSDVLLSLVLLPFTVNTRSVTVER